jgi:hypothetical protein
MDEKEAQKILDDLQGVRPEMLTDEAKKLFDAIMKIADERDEYKRKLKIKDVFLKLIIDIGYDYDGYDNDNEGLRSIIDELVDYARKALKEDDESVIYVGGSETEEKKLNILGEEI